MSYIMVAMSRYILKEFSSLMPTLHWESSYCTWLVELLATTGTLHLTG